MELKLQIYNKCNKYNKFKTSTNIKHQRNTFKAVSNLGKESSLCSCSYFGGVQGRRQSCFLHEAVPKYLSPTMSQHTCLNTCVQKHTS